jgi:hypothetical protein
MNRPFHFRERACSPDSYFLGLDNHDVGSLKTFRALFDRKFDTLAFLQGAEAIGLYRAEVHENIRAALPFNEAIAFARIEPFDRACYPFVHFVLLLRKTEKNRVDGFSYSFNRRRGLLAMPEIKPPAGQAFYPDRLITISRENTFAILRVESLSGIDHFVKVSRVI